MTKTTVMRRAQQVAGGAAAVSVMAFAVACAIHGHDRVGGHRTSGDEGLRRLAVGVGVAVWSGVAVSLVPRRRALAVLCYAAGLADARDEAARAGRRTEHVPLAAVPSVAPVPPVTVVSAAAGAIMTALAPPA